MSSEERELDATTLREMAIFALVGAQISGGSAYLASSLMGATARRAPVCVEVVAAVVWVATFAYVVLTGR